MGLRLSKDLSCKASQHKAFPLRGRWTPEGRSDEVENAANLPKVTENRFSPAHCISQPYG